MAIGFDDPVAFDSPSYTFDGAAVGALELFLRANIHGSNGQMLISAGSKTTTRQHANASCERDAVGTIPGRYASVIAQTSSATWHE